MHVYSAYDLTIASDIRLQELPNVSEEPSSDIRIREGPVTLPRDPEAVDDHCVRATPTEATYFFDGVGAVRVSDGREIIVDSVPGAADAHIRFVLLGTALGMLLHQRGHLVLHASAVAIDDRVIAFLGGTGTGKSTLAAALYARGHDVVSDDMVVVPDCADPQVPPGGPLLKLDETTVDSVSAVPGLAADADGGRSTAAFQSVTESVLSKRFYRVDRTPSTARPLTDVYVLARGETPTVESLPPRERSMALIRHSYARRRLQATNAVSRNFQHCGTLAESVPVRRLTVPPSYRSLSDVVERIESESAPAGGDPDARHELSSENGYRAATE